MTPVQPRADRTRAFRQCTSGAHQSTRTFGRPGRATDAANHHPGTDHPRSRRGNRVCHKPCSDAALSPATASGGPAPAFTDKLPSGAAYEWDLRVRVASWIDDAYKRLAAGKGEAEHADPGKLWDWARFEEIAAAAKAETDAVFGSYATRPAYRAGVNLQDRWEDQDKAIFGTKTPAGRVGGKSAADQQAQAEDLIRYIMSADRGLLKIHKDHGAQIDRAPEKDIIEKVVTSVAAAQQQRLLEIDRGWVATADPSTSTVFVQRWKKDATPGRSADLNNRAMFWDMFKTLVHEYMHTLAHPDFETKLQATYRYGSSQQNTLGEGVDSVLTDVVWARVISRAPQLRSIIEKPFAAQPADMSIVPTLQAARYPSFEQGMALVRVVGMQNLYAAYFLGRTDLIGL